MADREGNPIHPDLELVPIEELAHELMKRMDVCVIGGYNIRTGAQAYPIKGCTFCTGAPLLLTGLCGTLQYKFAREHDESQEIIPDNDNDNDNDDEGPAGEEDRR